MKQIIVILLTFSLSLTQVIPGNPGNTRGNLFTWIADYFNIPQSVQENTALFVYIILVIGFLVYSIYTKRMKEK